jgi:hypothetical protein
MIRHNHIDSDTMLLTFGCSWTYGVGVNWKSGMSKEEYKKDAWNNIITNRLSWRGLLCDKNSWYNNNFSRGGSSNQLQFRLAKQYFASEKWQNDRKKYKNVKVLWGITSTARYELWDSNEQELKSVSLTDKSMMSKMAMFFYDHLNELRNLSLEIIFWNKFFRLLEIDNYWFDTFNHHDYKCEWPGLEKEYETFAGVDWPSWPDYYKGNFDGVPDHVKQELSDSSSWGFTCSWNQTQIDRLIDKDTNPRDILSALAIQNDLPIDDRHHTSSWRDDTIRISGLVKQGILNPISYHPTQIGHEKIAEWFEEKLPNFFKEHAA